MDSADSSNGFISNLPLTIGILSALFIACRILSFAEFNIETAYAILQEGGTAAVLIGAGLQSLPLIVIPTMGYFVAFHKPFRSRDTFIQAILLFILIVSLITVIFVVPLILLVITLLSFLVGILTSEFQTGKQLGTSSEEEGAKQNLATRREANARAKRERNARSMIVACIGILFALGVMFNTSGWLPTERLTMHNRTISGFVLSISNGYYAILLIKPREVIYINSSEVTNKSLCAAQASWFRKPLSYLFYKPYNYPSCP